MFGSCSLCFLHTSQVCAWLSNSTHLQLCEKCSLSWITPPPSGQCSWLWRCQGQTCDQTSLVPPSTELQTSPPPPGGTRMSDRIHSNDQTLCGCHAPKSLYPFVSQDPLDYTPQSLLKGHQVVVGQEVRAGAVDGVRARPHGGCRLVSIALCRDPEGLRLTPPHWIGVIDEGEVLAAEGIVHVARHDPVRLGEQPRHLERGTNVIYCCILQYFRGSHSFFGYPDCKDVIMMLTHGWGRVRKQACKFGQTAPWRIFKAIYHLFLTARWENYHTGSSRTNCSNNIKTLLDLNFHL